jgi:hypothetical protein
VQSDSEQTQPTDDEWVENVVADYSRNQDWSELMQCASDCPQSFLKRCEESSRAVQMIVAMRHFRECTDFGGPQDLASYVTELICKSGVDGEALSQSLQPPLGTQLTLANARSYGYVAMALGMDVTEAVFRAKLCFASKHVKIPAERYDRVLTGARRSDSALGFSHVRSEMQERLLKYLEEAESQYDFSSRFEYNLTVDEIKEVYRLATNG